MDLTFSSTLIGAVDLAERTSSEHLIPVSQPPPESTRAEGEQMNAFICGALPSQPREAKRRGRDG